MFLLWGMSEWLACRPGRPGKSGACGALIKALSDLKEEGLDENCKTPGGMLLSLNVALVCMVMYQTGGCLGINFN